VLSADAIGGICSVTLSRPLNAPDLRRLIFDFLELGFVFFSQDLEAIWAAKDVRASLPVELREVPFVRVNSAEQVWPPDN